MRPVAPGVFAFGSTCVREITTLTNPKQCSSNSRNFPGMDQMAAGPGLDS